MNVENVKSATAVTQTADVMEKYAWRFSAFMFGCSFVFYCMNV